MARILIISSFIAQGAVGGGVTQFVLQRHGHDTILLPTVLLSNHPGPKKFSGDKVAPSLLAQMIDAYDANGWLEDIEAVFCGYMPSPAHAAFAAATIRRIKAKGGKPIVCVDPILGDEPGGLYISQDAADAIRADLIPLADIITPNRFEFLWLTGINELSGDLDGTGIGAGAVANKNLILQGAAKLGAPTILVTSAGQSNGEILSLLLEAGRIEVARSQRLRQAPHGTGDLTAALYLAHRLNGAPSKQAFKTTIDAVTLVIKSSHGLDALPLAQMQQLWAAACAGS